MIDTGALVHGAATLPNKDASVAGDAVLDEVGAGCVKRPMPVLSIREKSGACGVAMPALCMVLEGGAVWRCTPGGVKLPNRLLPIRLELELSAGDRWVPGAYCCVWSAKCTLRPALLDGGLTTV